MARPDSARAVAVRRRHDRRVALAGASRSGPSRPDSDPRRAGRHSAPDPNRTRTLLPAGLHETSLEDHDGRPTLRRLDRAGHAAAALDPAELSSTTVPG